MRTNIKKGDCCNKASSKGSSVGNEGKDRCCVSAYAAPPTPPSVETEEDCQGTIFEVAIPGECAEETGKSCALSGVTGVRVREFNLKWNRKKSCCEVGEKTGESTVVAVSTCTGDSCSSSLSTNAKAITKKVIK